MAHAPCRSPASSDPSLDVPVTRRPGEQFPHPDLLQNLGSSLRRQVRDELLKRLLPGDTDVVFQTAFIDNFLANDRGAISRDSDVHDWRSATPVSPRAGAGRSRRGCGCGCYDPRR